MFKKKLLKIREDLNKCGNKKLEEEYIKERLLKCMQMYDDEMNEVYERLSSRNPLKVLRALSKIK